jgi:hypothetical protein
MKAVSYIGRDVASVDEDVGSGSLRMLVEDTRQMSAAACGEMFLDDISDVLPMRS